MASNFSCLWILLLQLLSLALADVSHLEYSITPSSQVAYYHYPAPSRQQQQQQQPGVQRVVQQRYQQAQAARPSQQYHQVARQFAEPALEHAAFTQALTSQGYVFGAPSAPLQVASSAPLQVASSAPLQVASSAPLQVASSASQAQAATPGVATGRAIPSAVDANSLNLKLPVPFGIAPLNVAQLPLQAGAPYASVPRTTGLTSYGTPQIQRR